MEGVLRTGRRLRAGWAAAAVSVLAAAGAGCSASHPPDGPAGESPAPAPDTAPEAGAAPTTPPSAPTTTEPAPDPPSTTVMPEPPYGADLPWGAFVLADPIVERLDAGRILTFVMSVASTGPQGSGPAMGPGFERGTTEAASRHRAGIEHRVIGPEHADADAQAAGILSLVESGEVDCLVVEGPSVGAPEPAAGALESAVGAAVRAGVPVFTVGEDAPGSERFAFYGVDGRAAAETVGAMAGQWAAEQAIAVREAGVLTSAARDPRSRARMEGFVAGITSVLPGVEFVNDSGDGLELPDFEPSLAYELTAVWILENPGLDIVFHTDSGLAMTASVLAAARRYGDTFAAGFLGSEPLDRYVRSGLVAAAVAADRAGEARAAAGACADFLLAGQYATGHVAVAPLPVAVTATDDGAQ